MGEANRNFSEISHIVPFVWWLWLCVSSINVTQIDRMLTKSAHHSMLFSLFEYNLVGKCSICCVYMCCQSRERLKRVKWNPIKPVWLCDKIHIFLIKWSFFSVQCSLIFCLPLNYITSVNNHNNNNDDDDYFFCSHPVVVI